MMLASGEATGWVLIDDEAARGLSAREAFLTTVGILGCSRTFRRGDKIYVIVRGSDGRQRLEAMAIAQCDASELGAYGEEADQRHASWLRPRVVIRGEEWAPL